MEKTTNYQLGNLISKNLDLDLFFAIIIYKISTNSIHY